MTDNPINTVYCWVSLGYSKVFLEGLASILTYRVSRQVLNSPNGWGSQDGRLFYKLGCPRRVYLGTPNLWPTSPEKVYILKNLN